jgi:WD40 repeat protein
LRTAVKWKVLEGHEGPVTCMSFDESGKYLASFSIEDSSLRLWKVGATGFIGSILGIQNKSFKSWQIPNKTHLKNELKSKTKLMWKAEKDLSITLVLGEIQTFVYSVGV